MNLLGKFLMSLFVFKEFRNWYPIIMALRLRLPNLVLVSRKTGKSIEINLATLILIFKLFMEGEIKRVGVYGENSLILDDVIVPKGVNPYIVGLLHAGWKCKGNFVTKGNVIFHLNDDLLVLYETFERQNYDCEVKNREVLDIGANAGDTAIYFSMKGASKIISCEPVPNIFDRMNQNLRLNSAFNVEPINCAIGLDGTSIELENITDLEYSGGTALNLQSVKPGSINVPIMKLTDIASKLKDTYLLKMDCEGCERGILSDEYDTVRKFTRLVVECHFEYPFFTLSKTVKLLRSDFNVDVKRIDIFTSKKERCLLYATRIENI